MGTRPSVWNQHIQHHNINDDLSIPSPTVIFLNTTVPSNDLRENNGRALLVGTLPLEVDIMRLSVTENGQGRSFRRKSRTYHAVSGIDLLCIQKSKGRVSCWIPRSYRWHWIHV